MKKNTAFLCAFLLLGNSASAGEVLNWQGVFEKGLRSNPELANARHALELSDVAYKKSFLNFYPEVSGSAGAGGADSGGDSYSYGLNARLSLFKGFQNTTELKLKRKNLSIQEAVYRQAVADFAYDLRISFAGLLKNQLTLKLLEDIYARRKSNLELVKLRYEAGREDKGAYLRSEADFLQARYEIRREARLMQTSLAELAKHIGADAYAVTEVTGTFDVPAPPRPPSRDMLLSNPGYLIARYTADAAALELKSRYGSLYPEITLSGSVSRLGDVWPPESESWSAGLSLSYPFFSGGRDFYEIKSAKLESRIAENNFRNTELDIALRLEGAYNDLIDALEYRQVREKYYSARKERSEIARVKYVNGLITYQDWDSIENEFISAQKSLLDAQYDVFTAWARWLRLLGEEG